MKRFTRVLAVLLIGAILPLVASNDKAAKALYQKGKAAEVRQDYIAAYNFYHQAYQLKPSDLTYRASFEYVRFLASASYVHQGEILVKAGKLQEGLTNFEQAIAIVVDLFEVLGVDELDDGLAIVRPRSVKQRLTH